MIDHVDFMAETLKQSKLASEDGETPFDVGTVKDDAIISRGR